MTWAEEPTVVHYFWNTGYRTNSVVISPQGAVFVGSPAGFDYGGMGVEPAYGRLKPIR
jgi:sugar lactone lactonase YvrE